MKSVIALLQISLATLVNNEPIQRTAGNVEQADLDLKSAGEIREALALLDAPEASRPVSFGSLAPSMRAKLRVGSVVPSGEGEIVQFHAVSKSDGYPADGSDENNTYAKWSPQADFTLNVQNPALLGKHVPGAEFYVDFTPAAAV